MHEYGQKRHEGMVKVVFKSFTSVGRQPWIQLMILILKSLKEVRMKIKAG
jgi:hypothetical protein